MLLLQTLKKNLKKTCAVSQALRRVGMGEYNSGFDDVNIQKFLIEIHYEIFSEALRKTKNTS